MLEHVREAIDAIRPPIRADGGDITLVAVDEGSGVVTVEMAGSCGSCLISTATLRAGVDRILRDRVPGVTAVEVDEPVAETPVIL